VTEEDDLSFYQRRLREELALERNATHPAAKSAHRLLAGSYQKRVDKLVRGGGRTTPACEPTD
jgi:hypothetical protein